MCLSVPCSHKTMSTQHINRHLSESEDVFILPCTPFIFSTFLKNHSTFEFNLKIYFSVRSTRDSGKQHRPVSFRFSATCEADIRKYTKEAYACKEKNNSLLLSMAIKLSQRCSSTNIKEVNATFLTASNKQIAIISVCGTISSIFEARKRFDWFLGVTTINVDLAKQEDIKFAHRIPAEEKEHKNLRKATYP